MIRVFSLVVASGDVRPSVLAADWTIEAVGTGVRPAQAVDTVYHAFVAVRAEPRRPTGRARPSS
jgi:hypothetical protein